MAILECRYDDVERGKTMFEGLLDRTPNRLDLWNVYIDQIAKTGDIQTCRALVERALDRKLTAKKAKFLFKKWMSLEARIGDSAGQEQATLKAREWVAANAARAEEDEEEDE
jgi:rRNA biogenesis protein RRP5